MFTTISFALFIGGLFVFFSYSPNLGGKNSKDAQIEIQKSKNYKKDKFQNLIPSPMAAPKFSTMVKFFSKNEVQIPGKTLNTEAFSKEKFESTPQNTLSFCWFGHSTVLLRIENQTILIDPVFGKRASMFSFIGPTRFNYSNQYQIDQLPKIDAVLISHDHYDHLEYESILALKDKVNRFFVPLGVGVHLEKWGVSPKKITELDWWNEIDYSNEIKLVFTPARHFSGRSLLTRNQTLWGSWSILGLNQKVFFGGDSGYFDEFKNVGDKFGPFDLAFVENGQYNEDWANIHMMPEQSALVGSELKAKAVVPIHWGKFSLSVHAWEEPVVRFLKASKEYDYQSLTPYPGQIMTFPWQITFEWWKS